MIKSNIACGLRINIVGQDRIRPKFAKAIKVQLPCETRKIAVLEVKWKDGTSKFLDVLYNKIVTRCGPCCDIWIASIDHVVCFCSIATEKAKLDDARMQIDDNTRNEEIISSRNTVSMTTGNSIDLGKGFIFATNHHVQPYW